jgi:hypothetical protein
MQGETGDYSERNLRMPARIRMLEDDYGRVLIWDLPVRIFQQLFADSFAHRLCDGRQRSGDWCMWPPGR